MDDEGGAEQGRTSRRTGRNAGGSGAVRAALAAAGLAVALVLAGCASSGGAGEFGHLAAGSTTGPTDGGSSDSGPTFSPDPPSADTGTAGGKLTTSPEDDYTVRLPSGWTNRPDIATKEKLTATYIGPRSDDFNTNITITGGSDVGSDVDLDDFQKVAFDRLKADLHPTDVSPTTHTTLDGEDAVRYDFQDTQGGQQLRQQQIISIHDDKDYVLTYTATSTSYGAYVGVADAIADSWRWT